MWLIDKLCCVLLFAIKCPIYFCNNGQAELPEGSHLTSRAVSIHHIILTLQVEVAPHEYPQGKVSVAQALMRPISLPC